MGIKAVVFDLDGTLVDTAPDFIVTLKALLKEEGRDAPSDRSIRNTVSEGARALVSLGFDMDDSHPEFERLRVRLLDLYTQHLADASHTFPGVQELLDWLVDNDIAWGVATNKPVIYAEPLLKALNLIPPQDCLICPDHVTERKPHPESIYLAAHKFECKPEEIVYVGDHQRDIDCGKNAGSPTIAAAYGYVENRQEAEAWQADYTVDHANEIRVLIESLL